MKPNYKTLGPRFGSNMPLVTSQVEKLDPLQTKKELNTNGFVVVTVNGVNETLSQNDLVLDC